MNLRIVVKEKGSKVTFTFLTTLIPLTEFSIYMFKKKVKLVYVQLQIQLKMAPTARSTIAGNT